MSEHLLSRYRRLQAEVAGHKVAIARERAALRSKATELAAVRAECNRLGINIVTVPRSGIGDLHSHADRSS